MRPYLHAAVSVAVLSLGACQTSNAPTVTPVGDDVLARLEPVRGAEGDVTLQGMGFARLAGEALEDLVYDNTVKTGSTYAYYKWDNRVYIRDTALGLRSRGTWDIEDGNICVTVGEGRPFCTAVFVREGAVLCWPNYGEFPDDTGFARSCELMAGNAIPVNE